MSAPLMSDALSGALPIRLAREVLGRVRTERCLRGRVRWGQRSDLLGLHVNPRTAEGYPPKCLHVDVSCEACTVEKDLILLRKCPKVLRLLEKRWRCPCCLHRVRNGLRFKGGI